GWLHPAFVTNPERNECVLEDVVVLLHEKKLTSIRPLLERIQQISQEGKSIFVVAEDVTDEALAILAVNCERKLLRACAVRSPGGLEHLQDIAALTGGQVVTENVKLAEAKFGYAKKIIVKPISTTIVSSGTNSSLDTRLRSLRTQVSEAANEAD